MRLHHLRVQALQAFATSAEVDFDALSDAGLFLLHGNTGAGKTTLLDAVCFALFGKLPGARGTNARERADLAAADLPTEVTLELTLRGERLRITRTPKQERPKVRGTGTTTVHPTVLLQTIAADGTARALATRHDEVAHELDRLLGMSREQFCQVVLLPQGQFATFLNAKSDDREELLARLFGTERFEQAERWLSDRRRQIEELARAAMKDITATAAKLEEVLQTTPPEDPATDPAALTAWADAAQVLADAELAAATGVSDEAAAARARADAALVAVRDLLRLRDQHAAAVTDLEAFRADTPARDEAEAVVRLARRAAVVQPLLAVAASEATKAAAAEASAAAACLPLHAEDEEPIVLRRAAATHRTAAGEVQALTAVEVELQVRDAQLTVAQQDTEIHQQQADAAAGWLTGAEATRVTLAAAAQAGRLALARRDEHATAAEAAATRLLAGRRRDELVKTVERDGRRSSQAKDAEQEDRAAWLDLRERRLNGMAAELADGLQDGAPCLVCGALEHPEPAAHLVGGQVTAQEERDAQGAAEVSRGLREAIDRALADGRTQLAAAIAVAGDEPTSELAAAAEAARALAAETAAAAATAGAAESALGEHDTRRTELEEQRTRAQEQLGALAARITELTAVQEQDAERLHEALAGAASIADRVRGLQTLAAAYDAAAAAVQQAHDTAAAAGESAARALTAAQEAGFADRDAAAAAILTPEAIQAHEVSIRAHDDGLAERRRQVADPDLLAAVAAPAPDEEAAKTTAREAAEADAAGGQALERVRHRAESLRRLRRELEQRLAAHGPLAQEAATVRALAMLVDGTSAQNEKRMRLRAYVLAARLEEIAAVASERLLVMTDGRYRLSHDDERASRGARSGLGLQVVDGWTGQDRHPASLSGGETFLASLALALGLADVVAAGSGGARLETLFVDEGFGSLDEGTLDEVLDVLDRLRDGGRAVGVVSHVAELRQRITAQLHVVKQRGGSRVEQLV